MQRFKYCRNRLRRKTKLKQHQNIPNFFFTIIWKLKPDCIKKTWVVEDNEQ